MQYSNTIAIKWLSNHQYLLTREKRYLHWEYVWIVDLTCAKAWVVDQFYSLWLLWYLYIRNIFQCLGPINPFTQLMINCHSALSIFGGNMTLMISVYKGHIPMLWSNRPNYTNNDYFSFFLSLICVSGCRGPKFKFTAKNIASGFFSDLLSETWQ